MKKITRRVSSALTAAALLLTVTSAVPGISAAEEDSDVIFSDECENLTLSDGMQIWTSVYDKQLPGYSGEGFVYVRGDSFSFTVDAPEDGLYDLNFRCAQLETTEGLRLQTVNVNGKKLEKWLPYLNEWTDVNFGRVRLNKGENTFEVTGSWGYAEYDTVTVSKAQVPELNIEPTLSDKNATKETQGLMNYLCDVYGKHIISGQQEIYGNGHTEDQPAGYSGKYLQGYESEFEWIHDNFGVYPAIRGFDYQNVNPLYGWDDGTTERIIEWANERNGIPTVCQHISLPTDFANYTVGDEVDWSAASYKPNSSFSVKNATIEGTKEYEYTMLCIDLLAQELLKIQDAGVPVIFRPYHEAQGNYDGNSGQAWFWWGQEGPEAYVALWRQLYTTLTEKYGLHNLIWEFNSYLLNGYEDWYPGDEYVDIVGFDKYNCVYNRTDGLSNCPNEDAISDTFYKLVDLTNNTKLVSMPENDTVPSLENMLIEKANWLYFCVWYDNGSENFLSGTNKNNPETLKEVYQSDYCITLDELPDWKNYNMGDIQPTDPTEPTEETTETPTTNPDIDFIPGDVREDGVVNVFDAVALREILINSIDSFPLGLLGATASDTNGNGHIEVSDLVLLHQYLVGKDVELKYYTGNTEE